MSGFKYFRNKKTGSVMRTLALPHMGQNSLFEEACEEDFRKPVVADPPQKAVAKKAAKKEAPPETPPVPENDDLTAGLDYGEDSR